ncbi:MAG: hypothetical protein GWN81_06000, partial [Phycisphaerae bacterium]|nr:hypothetical protein [Phycisphaerae bacterium]NIU08408.1 hypothetical protein [Phycisphaerae bacterium]NIX27397.1 hypothetical protein [Phycisphaerae bacterium]NIX57545.1 hypothetical protein [candidate division Zixibacteria bacterium]
MALFRNISWPRIFAEGVVIVVSILLALWIDTWWGERQERKLELDYLEALQKDFEETRENLEIHIEEVSILLDQVDKVLTV